MNSTNSAKELVTAFVTALNNEDFAAARSYLTDDMKFIGVLGTRDGGDAYINDMQRMKIKYNVQKTFADGNDVCLLADIAISGTTIFNCGWYQVAGNKIKSLKVVFDPRPLLK
jgi:limonene-1,2-epoxide hydrolase